MDKKLRETTNLGVDDRSSAEGYFFDANDFLTRLQQN